MSILVVARLLGGRKTTIWVHDVADVHAARKAVDMELGCRCILALVPRAAAPAVEKIRA